MLNPNTSTISPFVVNRVVVGSCTPQDSIIIFSDALVGCLAIVVEREHTSRTICIPTRGFCLAGYWVSGCLNFFALRA